MEEYKISFQVINEHIDSNKSFTYDEITNEILKRDGVLRVAIGVTIRMYLKNLCEIGLLTFKPLENKYNVNQDALKEY